MGTATASERKRLGAWYTPTELVALVVDGVLDGFAPADASIRVVDPACGDGRFLVAVGDRLAAAGIGVELFGCDVDPGAVEAARRRGIAAVEADALGHPWQFESFDLVVGNPPFLSQMASATTRGGAGRGGAGPYADAAVEFLALATELARPDGGRIGLVLPQSILGARDAEPVRGLVEQRCRLIWSWWSPEQTHFDAGINVCALGFERPGDGAPGTWTQVVTNR
ncbi:MAG: SAM-dependent DNA methyltransferase, partial [Ilumatobacter sp.]|nr:SAM-dependent DNA methyltransferase [Ilumatobacter sp.]